MSTHITSQISGLRRAAHAATTIAASVLLLAATACSSDSDAATTGTSIAPTTSPPATTPETTPPVSSAPPTSAAPTTSSAPRTSAAPATASEASRAHEALLTGILDSHHAAGEFVGARIALLEDDGTITEATAGTTTVDAASGPVDLDVAWNVGSVTKTFVAVVVLQLADEGSLDLDAGIDRFLPDLPEANRITPRQLLQHTSGLGEYGDQPAVLTDSQREWTPSELIAVAEAAGRTGEPGSVYHYSNTNYIVLGEIIERVTGNPWADEVRTRIVEPLGMTNTSAITDEGPIGYQLIDGSFVDTTSSAHPSLGGAAGSMQSVGRDLLLFAAALVDGTLLSPGSQSAMEAFVPGEDYSQFGIVHGYGLGLEQYANAAITVIGHMGTGEAQSAFVGYDAEHGTAVAVMTNTANPGPQALMAIEALIAVGEAA